MFSEPSDPIPGAVRQLVTLFEDELADVEFPGVGLQSLGEHMQAVQERDKARHDLEERLATAREALDESRRALTRHAEQAIAYVRVFATQRPALQQKLEGLELARPPRAPVKKGRGRRTSRKSEDTTSSALPLVAEQGASPDARVDAKTDGKEDAKEGTKRSPPAPVRRLRAAKEA